MKSNTYEPTVKTGETFKRPNPRPKRLQTVEAKPEALPTMGNSILAKIGRNMLNPFPKFVPHEKVELIKRERIILKRPSAKTSIINPVNVILRVSGSKVKVRLDCKMFDIHQKYLAKGKKPPLMEYVRALISFGYAEEKINKVVESYKMWENKEFLDKLQADIELSLIHI